VIKPLIVPVCWAWRGSVNSNINMMIDMKTKLPFDPSRAGQAKLRETPETLSTISI